MKSIVVWDPIFFISMHSYYRAIQVPSSSTYSLIQFLAVASWLSLQTNFTKSLSLMILQHAGNLCQSSLPPMLALTTSMVGLEYPRHLFIHVISGSISTFVSILYDEFLFLHDATSALSQSRGTFFDKGRILLIHSLYIELIQ